MPTTTSPTPRGLRPHQAAAIHAATAALVDHDRGQLHMACGTGKTLTALRLAEQLQVNAVLVLVPSLSLLAQTLHAWRQDCTDPFRAVAVCSDDTVAESETGALVDIPVPVTTSPDIVAAALAGRGDGRTVVFATYHSAGVVAAAQTMGAQVFDLAVADEAHRTAGRAAESFRLILDGDRIRAAKRVFMTATPRLTKGQAAASMDDENLYGPVMFRFGFPEAIAAGLLCDYQVVVVGVTDAAVREQLEQGAEVMLGGRVLHGQDAAAAVAVLKAMRTHGITRMITFHGTVERARSFATTLSDVADCVLGRDEADGLSTGHVNGEMSTGERAARLQALRRVPPGQRHVLTNARCLTEGVDVPAIDGVAFIDPRSSYVDIVQAVGRALRTAPGKRVGTILLPVYLAGDDDPHSVLASSAFADVCTVINALRDHDQAFGAALDGARSALAADDETAPRLPRNLIVDLPTHLGPEFRDALYTRIVRQTTRPFWEKLQRLADHLARHDTYPPSRTELYRFITEQRMRRRRGEMTGEEAAALESLPGWAWDRDALDDTVRAEVQAMHQAGMTQTQIAAKLNADGVPGATGPITWTPGAVRRLILGVRQCNVTAISRADRWDRRYIELQQWTHANGPLRRLNRGLDNALSLWMATQKKRYRAADARLTPDRIARLEELPGWFWELARTSPRKQRAA